MKNRKFFENILMNKKEIMPLNGILVLDMTNVLSGPFATLILKDLGAKIIKIEKPEGDDSRKFGPFIKKKSCYFVSLNRGKKSIVLDLKNSEDLIIFKKLLAKADVLIDNYKPGVLEKFGFNWEYINKNYPKLIHSKISGFGETGPLRKAPAYDIIVQAIGGVMSITGSDKKNIARVGTSIGDITASLYCVIGVLGQLILRNRINRGSKLDFSMLDCQVAILENAIARYSVEKKNPFPLGSDHPSITPFGSFKTLNEKIVVAIGNENLFKKFCESINDEEMLKMKIFKSNVNRNKNIKKLRFRIEKALKKEKASYWLKIFKKKGIPSAKIHKISDLIDNSQVKNRGMIMNYKDKFIKKLKLPGNPLKFNFSNDKKVTEPAPDLNENKKEILKLLKD